VDTLRAEEKPTKNRKIPLKYPPFVFFPNRTGYLIMHGYSLSLN